MTTDLKTYLQERTKAAAQVSGLINSHIVVYADSRGEPSAVIKRTEAEAIDMMMDNVGKNSWLYSDPLQFLVAKLEADPAAVSPREETTDMAVVRRKHENREAERREKRSRFLERSYRYGDTPRTTRYGPTSFGW